MVLLEGRHRLIGHQQHRHLAGGDTALGTGTDRAEVKERRTVPVTAVLGQHHALAAAATEHKGATPEIGHQKHTLGLLQRVVHTVLALHVLQHFLGLVEHVPGVPALFAGLHVGRLVLHMIHALGVLHGLRVIHVATGLIGGDARRQRSQRQGSHCDRCYLHGSLLP